MPLRIRLLGPLHLSDGPHTRTPRGSVERALLALTALHPGESLSADRLIARVWPDGAPTGARRRLHRVAEELRVLLDGPGAQGWAWRSYTDGSCHRLTVPPGGSDLLTVRGLIAETRLALRTGTAGRAAETARAALRLWGDGAVLADVPQARHWPEMAGLREERWQLVEDCLEAELAEGRPGVTDELWRLVRTQPRRERPRAMLISALGAAGRPKEAWQVYLDARSTLAEEWGLDPGPDLRRQGELLTGSGDEGSAAPTEPVTLVAVRIGDELTAHRATGPAAPIDQRLVGCVTSCGGEMAWLWNHECVAVFSGPGHPASGVRAALAVRALFERAAGAPPGWLRIAVCHHRRARVEPRGVTAPTGQVVDPAGMRACASLLEAGGGLGPVVDRHTYQATRTTTRYRRGPRSGAHEALGGLGPALIADGVPRPDLGASPVPAPAETGAG